MTKQSETIRETAGAPVELSDDELGAAQGGKSKKSGGKAGKSRLQDITFTISANKSSV